MRADTERGRNEGTADSLTEMNGGSRGGRERVSGGRRRQTVEHGTRREMLFTDFLL